MGVCFRQVLRLVLGGLVLAVLVFILLYTGLITLVPATALGIAFFSLIILISGAGLLALTSGVLRADRTPALADAWLCCGETAAVGAVGALLSSLVTFLTVSLEIGLYAGIALTFFFLALMVGGLLCFIRRYVTARFHSDC